jgi:hypothetical protein
MDNKEYPICLIKFGKKKHLESLLTKGELYFNKTENFNQINFSNKEQSDENEGARWIENTRFSEIKVDHQILGEIVFKPASNEYGKITQFNHNYLTCSFFVITTKDFENTNTLKIDDKMLEFGDYAIIINNPKLFLENVVETLESENLVYEAQKVKYKKLESRGHIEMTPFVKKIEHQHQKEFRIILKNQIEPKTIQIKDINDIGEIVTSQFLVESVWEVTRK